MKGKEDSNDIVREGFVQKRGGRMHSWNKRYFLLTSNKIAYKVKNDSSPYKAAFDLVPGCKVTEVREETIGAIKGRKAYTFWIVWPHDKNSSKANRDSKGNTDDVLSDDEEDQETTDANKLDTKTDENATTETKKSKGLKTIVETEVMAQRSQQRQAEAQVERHQAHDNNISLGFKVAALTVGGVIIGAATMGTGLVPYLLVVGVSAVAGGGAILSVRRPSDSRIILAFDTMWLALDWKQSIELQINRLESKLKPTLPLFTDPNVISYLMSSTSNFHDQTWKKVHIREDMRIMKHLSPMDGTHCFRAQLVIHSSPVSVFLALMESNCWPTYGQFKIEKAVDDHADIIGVTVKTKYKKLYSEGYVDRNLTLSRFWKLDDDGVYLITLTSVESSVDNITEAHNNELSSTSTLTAVITVSPRVDHTIYDDDLSESLVCCTIQVSADANWRPGEMHAFVNDFLQQHLLGVRQNIMLSKYNVTQRDNSSGADIIAYNTIIEGPNIPKKVVADAAQTSIDEDQSNTPHTPERGDKEDKQKAVDGPTKDKQTRRFFRRPLIGRGKPVETTNSSDNDNKNTAPESIANSPNHTPTRGRTKSATINLEASALRGKIASKEYERQRLDRVLRRKEKDKDKSGNVVVSSSVNSSNVLQQQKEQNLTELTELKVKYKKLTGTAYEESTRKGTLSRLRGYASRRIAKANPILPVTGAVVKTSNVSTFKAVAVHSSKRPYHWRPMKLDQNKVYIFDEDFNNDSKVNIAVVGIFIVCLLGTFCLANLLSSIL